MPKTIHILGCGGPAGVGLTRCLKDHYTVTGEDSSQWAELMMECPSASIEPGRVDVYSEDYQQIMQIALPDSLVQASSFCPTTEQVRLCQDKAATARVLGELAPKIYWVRDTHGAGGAGAQMQSEFLPGDNYSQEVVFFKGRKLATFQKKRVSYSVKSKTQGIDNRGSSAVSVCTDNDTVYDVANVALSRLPGELHGFYGVDLKCDENGFPRVTEINAGRLLTASYAFFSETGYNLPLVGVRAYFGEDLPELPDYPLGWGQIRQVGQEPRFFGPEITKDW